MKIKSIKSIGKRKVYDISVQDVEHYILENGVVTHNTGLIYSANTAFIIGKSQEKDGNDLIGYNFTLNVEKSRYVREKSKLVFTVTYEGGIQKYSGLLELGLESGAVIKPSNGWYQKVNLETGELQEKKYRAKETQTEEFWSDILTSPKFKTFVKERFQLGAAYNTVVTDDDIDSELDAIEMEDDLND